MIDEYVDIPIDYSTSLCQPILLHPGRGNSMSSFFNKYFWNISSETMSRKSYWLMVLTISLMGGVVGLSAAVAAHLYDLTDVQIVSGIIPLLVPLYWISIVCNVKRFRDTGVSGWWYITGFIPYVGFVVVVVMTLLPTNYFLRFKTTQEVMA